MKFVFTAVLILFLCFFTGCSDAKTQNKNETENSSAVTEATQFSKEPEETATTQEKETTTKVVTEATTLAEESPKETTTQCPPEQETVQVIDEETTTQNQNLPAVGENYFDDAAFVGDSVSLKLKYYCNSNGSLGNAKFFTAGSLGVANALWNVSDESVHPSYQGDKMLVEDCIAASGVKKVFIMFGMNDIGIYSMDASIANYKKLIARILEKNPDCQIFVQSMTPLTKDSTRADSKLNNENIKKYNGMLKNMCNENGWVFLDVASVMYDSDGKYLKDSYCSDKDSMGMHFTNEGCAAWVNYLKANVG